MKRKNEKKKRGRYVTHGRARALVADGAIKDGIYGYLWGGENLARNGRRARRWRAARRVSCCANN